LLTEFVQALAHTTGVGALIVACAVCGRKSDAARKLVGPFATTLPLVCRLQGTRDSLAQRLARDLQHAKAHAAFDFAACEEVYGAGWRVNNIAPLQFGFSYRDDSIVLPALLAAPTCHFVPLTAHRSSDSDVIANDIRLSISLARDTGYAELAYDADAVGAKFAEALLGVFLEGRAPADQRNLLPARRGW
jgi:hypothetical protein